MRDSQLNMSLKLQMLLDGTLVSCCHAPTIGHHDIGRLCQWNSVEEEEEEDNGQSCHAVNFDSFLSIPLDQQMLMHHIKWWAVYLAYNRKTARDSKREKYFDFVRRGEKEEKRDR